MTSADLPSMNDETVRRVISPLAKAKGWMKLMGVLSIIYGVLIGITIIGLVVAWLPIWVGVLLWQSADKAELAAESGNETDAVEATSKLKTIFTIYGVLTLVGIVISVLYAIAIVVLISSGRFDVQSLGSLLTSR